MHAWHPALRSALDGFLRPAHILAAVWRDPTARRRHLRIGAAQLAVILVIVGMTLPSSLEGIRAAGGRVRRSDSLLVFSSIAYANYAVVEWIVLALCREYNDALVRAAGLLTGGYTEIAVERPRVRIDFRYFWWRIKRQISGALLFGTGLPVLAALRILPFLGFGLYRAAGVFWGAYWFALFTIGKTQLAYEGVTPGEPWFLRAWQLLIDRVALFRWFLPRAYGRLWRRLTRKVAGPGQALEDAPFEVAGLVCARLLSSIPIVSVFAKPAIPVAAAQVIEHTHRARA
jgi:hypothetical protein